MSAQQLLDAAGRPRSPATMPGHHVGRIPPNKGRRYPADPPTVDEIVAVMRQAGDDRHGRRMRGLIVVLWRAGRRIHEALTPTETDLNERRGSLLIRHGKGDRRREVGMDPWAWSVLAEWTADRIALPAGPLFCVIGGPTRGRAWSATAVRAELRHLAHRGCGAAPVRATPAPPCACCRDGRNATLNYRSVLARELTAKDARLYGRTRRQRRSRRATTDDWADNGV